MVFDVGECVEGYVVFCEGVGCFERGWEWDGERGVGVGLYWGELCGEFGDLVE